MQLQCGVILALFHPCRQGGSQTTSPYVLQCSVILALFHPCRHAGRQPHYQSICRAGQKLRTEGQLASKAIGHRVSQLQDKWKKLNDCATIRKTRLEEAARSQQVSWDIPGQGGWSRFLHHICHSPKYVPGHPAESANVYIMLYGVYDLD